VQLFAAWSVQLFPADSTQNNASILYFLFFILYRWYHCSISYCQWFARNVKYS